MNRTDQITAIIGRLEAGCLGDEEFCSLQDRLLDLIPEATNTTPDRAQLGLEPPY